MTNEKNASEVKLGKKAMLYHVLSLTIVMLESYPSGFTGYRLKFKIGHDILREKNREVDGDERKYRCEVDSKG